MGIAVTVTMPVYFGYLVVVAIVLGAFEVLVDESYLAVVQLAVRRHLGRTCPYVEVFGVPGNQSEMATIVKDICGAKKLHSRASIIIY